MQFLAHSWENEAGNPKTKPLGACASFFEKYWAQTDYSVKTKLCLTVWSEFRWTSGGSDYVLSAQEPGKKGRGHERDIFEPEAGAGRVGSDQRR